MTRCVAGFSDSVPISTTLAGQMRHAATEHGAHAGDQLLRRERLGDVVVGTGLQPGDLVLLRTRAVSMMIGSSRVRSSLRRRLASETPDWPGSIQSRISRSGSAARIAASASSALPCTHDEEAVVFEIDGQQFLNCRFVLDHQNRRRPQASLSLVWRTSRPSAILITCSAIFFAWSPIRSTERQIQTMSMAVVIVRGSSIM